MNKKMAIITASIVVLMLGGLTYLTVANPGSDNKSTQDNNESITPSRTDTDQNQTPGVYTDYQADKIAQTTGTKLLFFHAPWCPQCRALETSINNSVIPQDVTIFKVDYDTNQGLRQKYGVTLQTTFVKIDDQGNLIEKFVAYDEPTFASVKQNLL